VTAWPWPHESLLERARHVARIYREHLHTMSRERCDALDKAMADVGITWMTGRDVVYEDTDAITGDLAAELVGRPESVIRQWACLPHPDDPTKMLLPRFGWDDHRRTYLVGAVREAARLAEMNAFTPKGRPA
jgi:hypothetical protein